VAAEDEGSARILTEQLALTAAAARAPRDFPPAFADAFIATRLGRPWRATYGMIDGRFDGRALLDYVAPGVRAPAASTPPPRAVRACQPAGLG
jgi:putative acyl-CoA dehydrogenase